MFKNYIGCQFVVLFCLVSVIDASYPVRGIEDVVRGFEAGTGEHEMLAMKAGRRILMDLENTLSGVREQREPSSIEKPWTTEMLQDIVRRESSATIKRLREIDLGYAEYVLKLYGYFYRQLNALRSQKEVDGKFEEVEAIDKVLLELHTHPRLKYAESVVDAQKIEEETEEP